MTNTIRITNTLTQQAGRQATISTNLHTCVCVYACVCGRLGIGCGRTCETGMQSDSCVVLMQPQADTDKNGGEGKQA